MSADDDHEGSVARIIKTLREENLSLCQRLADLNNSRVTSPNSEADDLRQEVAQLKARLKSYESIASKKQHTRSHELSRVVDLRNSLAREFDEWKIEEQRDLEHELALEAETRARKKQLELAQEIERWQYEDSKKTRLIESLRSSLMKKESRILELTREVDSINSERRLANHFDISNSETNPNLILASSEIVALKEEKAILLQRFGAMEEVLTTKDAEIAALRLRLGEVEGHRRQERLKREQEIRDLKEEISALETSSAEMSLTISQFEIRMKEEIDQINEAADLREKECLHLVDVERKEVEKLNAALEIALKENERQDAEINTLQNTVDAKVNRIAELTDLAASIESELQAQKLDPTVECLAAQIREMQDELNAKDLQLTEKERLQATIKHLRDENRAIQGDLNQMNFHNRLLTRSCNELKHNSSIARSSEYNSAKDDLTVVQRLLIKSLGAGYNGENESLEIRGHTGMIHALNIVPNACSNFREQFLFKGDELIVLISNGKVFAQVQSRDGVSNLVDLVTHLDSKAAKSVRFSHNRAVGSTPLPSNILAPSNLSNHFGLSHQRNGIPFSYLPATSLPSPSAQMLSQLPLRRLPLSR